MPGLMSGIARTGLKNSLIHNEPFDRLPGSSRHGRLSVRPMRNSSSSASPEFPGGESSPRVPLHVAIAFDDSRAYHQALRILIRTVLQLGDDVELQPSPWPFTVLQSPDWRSLALRDAREADIFVVSASEDQPLPPALLEWINACAEQHKGAGSLLIALVASRTGDEAGRSANLALLRASAETAGWDFLTPHLSRQIDLAACY